MLLQSTNKKNKAIVIWDFNDSVGKLGKEMMELTDWKRILARMLVVNCNHADGCDSKTVKEQIKIRNMLRRDSNSDLEDDSDSNSQASVIDEILDLGEHMEDNYIRQWIAKAKLAAYKKFRPWASSSIPSS